MWSVSVVERLGFTQGMQKVAPVPDR
ncbi:hypothetical protein J2S55_003772 [Streptosporangium brasiliense]|uniref:Uncharacterized protein n=1 Tax=Streptosporangium brasiliense TaxID=47480 RepID=A0ABT9R5I3_9ACTN|nr:hypothetical protein [Streptosporangium brasiliense]